MCGIIGVVSQLRDAETVILEGIELLQNRGYDSAGIATISDPCEDSEEASNTKAEFTITKLATDSRKNIDCIEELKRKIPLLHKSSSIGMGHTRWATCGEKSDANSHPHFDVDRRIVLCHNGTLDNFHELRQELLSLNIRLNSQTDSELIAQLIALELKSSQPTINFKQAVQRVLETKIKGQWGLVIMDRESPRSMIVARNGSPILIGVSADAVYVASEKIAFEKHTNKFFTMNDQELLEISLDDIEGFKSTFETRIQTISTKTEVLTVPRHPHKHFFEQEIYEQPSTLLNSFSNGARLSSSATPVLRGLEPFREKIISLNHIIIVACGSSNLAGQFASHTFKKLRCFASVTVLEASEFTEYDLPEISGSEDVGMICISQSGETADVRSCLEIAKRQRIFSIGVVNTEGSQIATSVDCGVYVRCGREVAVAASKSFTSQCVVLLMIALWVSHARESTTSAAKENERKATRIKMISSLRALPTSVGITLFAVREQVKTIAQKLKSHANIIILGKGPCAAIAKEGALKLKELTYIHAEAFSAGELKHGPLALINPEQMKATAVVLIVLDNENFHEMNLALSEVHSRGAFCIVITNCLSKLPADKVDASIDFDTKNETNEMAALLSILPLQLLSYELCLALDTNPDKPRNLAKCVTVK